MTFRDKVHAISKHLNTRLKVKNKRIHLSNHKEEVYTLSSGKIYISILQTELLRVNMISYWATFFILVIQG